MKTKAVYNMGDLVVYLSDEILRANVDLPAGVSGRIGPSCPDVVKNSLVHLILLVEKGVVGAVQEFPEQKAHPDYTHVLFRPRNAPFEAHVAIYVRNEDLAFVETHDDVMDAINRIPELQKETPS